MTSFEDYIFQSFGSQISDWNTNLMPDIYALGFLIHFEEQDLRYGTVGLVYNTNRDYQSALTAAAIRHPEIHSAEADVEVKWHFDFWHQFELWVRDELPLVAKSHAPYADPSGAALRQEWLEEQHLWFSDEEEEDNFDRTLEISGYIDVSFYAACARVACRLHTDGYTKMGNKGAVPIVFHNYYYDEQAADHTRQANPPGLAEEFERYINVVRRQAKR